MPRVPAPTGVRAQTTITPAYVAARDPLLLAVEHPAVAARRRARGAHARRVAAGLRLGEREGARERTRPRRAAAGSCASAPRVPNRAMASATMLVTRHRDRRRRSRPRRSPSSRARTRRRPPPTPPYAAGHVDGEEAELAEPADERPPGTRSSRSFSARDRARRARARTRRAVSWTARWGSVGLEVHGAPSARRALVLQHRARDDDPLDLARALVDLGDAASR